jgi:hypothetical protein
MKILEEEHPAACEAGSDVARRIVTVWLVLFTFRKTKLSETFPAYRDDQPEQPEGRSSHNGLLE